MFSMGSSLYQRIWGTEACASTEKVVYGLGQLEVVVDLNPIGGYRGKVGSLAIHHVEHKVFTDWDEEDLLNLAKLERMVLFVQEQANVRNSLIFGRQDGEKEFNLKLVPYPKCNWIEKIQGLLHVIFGTPSLSEKQAEEIALFYQDQLDEEAEIPFTLDAQRDGKPDAFCRDDVINDQRIKDISFESNRYHLLHDKWPKGASADDPHFLIVAEGDSGHCDGSKVDEEKRFEMLKIAQKAMQILLQEQKYSTFLFLERNGEHLQGVQHKHDHVIGIQHFPATFLEKMKALLRQIFAPALSHLENRIQHYQQFEWL